MINGDMSDEVSKEDKRTLQDSKNQKKKKYKISNFFFFFQRMIQDFKLISLNLNFFILKINEFKF